MDNKELQKISLKFRKEASRFLTSSYPDFIDNLKRFLNFINSDETISQFLLANNVLVFDIENIVKSRKYNERYPSHHISSEEIAFTYQLLTHAANNFKDYYRLSAGYAYGNKFQDHADEFNKVVVYPFVQHITIYLEELAIDLRVDQSTKGINVHLNAENKGIMSFNQDGITNVSDNTFINSDVAEITKMISFIMELLENEVNPSKNKDEIIEVLNDLMAEVNSLNPKRNFILYLLDKVSQLQNVIALGITLSGPIKNLIDMIAQYLSKI